jgi:hypothetical protein
MSESFQLFATLSGAVVGAAIGVVSGFLIQRQLLKRENAREMMDRVYGPMLMQTSKMLEDVMSYNFYSGLVNPKSLMDDYLFFTIGQDLKSGLSEVLDRFDKYQTVRHAAELALDDAARQYYEETLGFSITGIGGGAENDYLRLLMGKPMVTALNLKSAIFLKLAPQDFIKREKEKWGEDIQIDVSIFGLENTLEAFESMYASMLAKMEKEPLYLKEREQRMRLVKELKKLIGQIKPFVKLK